MNTAPDYIIAIGASAGGMEEINTFFDHTPMDGVSYVIIQHLSPVFKSRMVELLAKHSKLVVREAENGMTVACNEVYLIPNDQFMTIENSRLYLSRKENIQAPHLTINTFFNSLAVNSGKKAIGIILSGLGTDGTEGVKAISEEGGMIIARDPQNAEFGSMPLSAIASGVADMILQPNEMPAAIEAYINKGIALEEERLEDEKQSKAIINFVKEQLPRDFTDYKQATILRRIKRRADLNNSGSLKEYLDFLQTTPEEVESLAQDFLISVTSFFRDKEAFDFIERSIIPGMIGKLLAGEELKLWVAGCATGEEAYSLAILIYEQLKDKDTVVKIFATDIDGIALAVAGKGIYNERISQDISPERLQSCFSKEAGEYKIIPGIRKMIIFAQHDLVKNPPYCNMHFISCRNLLIYMTAPLQKKIYLMLLFGLKMDGYLFLGSSENPLPILQHLEVLDKKWKLYRNLETKKAVNFEGFSLPQMVDIKHPHTGSSVKETQQHAQHNITEAINASLVKQLEYLAVCIDENNRVVKTYGDTTKYLLQKNFTLNLAELLPPELYTAFNSITIKAKKTNKTVKAKSIPVKYQGQVMHINISAMALDAKSAEQKLIMLLFSEDKTPALSQTQDTDLDENSYIGEYTQVLEQELNELKDKLSATYAQLDASNDNMQSYNEKLLSANEEMQSTNEEMQSVNEELHTINADYQLKNKELLELNDDLNNYFRSNINGQLFVNNDLLLMRYSPGTVNLINLLPADIGRPLSNISTNIKFETLTEDIKKVLADATIITREIETNNGAWYQVMTMPYIQQADNKKNGAVITFNDVTELKKMQIELNKKNKSLLRINEDLDNFVHTASHDLLAPLGNIEISIEVINTVKVVDPDVTHFLAIINSSIKKFRLLITEIATIAKIEKDMIAMEMVDLEELIANVEWSLSDKIKSTGATIVCQLDVTHILFSKKNLRSILFNLVSNGIKFRRDEPPVIIIHTSRQTDNVSLSVQDNGTGITKDSIDNIFGMYNRLQPQIEGQGIGLYLVKKIVQAASGEIKVESEPGKGSKFIINFNDTL